MVTAAGREDVKGTAMVEAGVKVSAVAAEQMEGMRVIAIRHSV